jgi:hypothetical protein
MPIRSRGRYRPRSTEHRTRTPLDDGCRICHEVSAPQHAELTDTGIRLHFTCGCWWDWVTTIRITPARIRAAEKLMGAAL